MYIVSLNNEHAKLNNEVLSSIGNPIFLYVKTLFGTKTTDTEDRVVKVWIIEISKITSWHLRFEKNAPYSLRIL